MPAGRSNRVLFDLIPHRDAEPSRTNSTGKPVVRIELKPQDAPTPRTSATPAPRPVGPAPRPESPASPGPAQQAPQQAPHHAPSHAPSHSPSHEPRSVQEIPRAAGTPYAKPAAKAATLRWPSFLGTSSLPVPLNLIYLSVAALVAVCVVVYLIGFGAGKSKAEANLAGSTRLEEPAVVEPRNGPTLSPPTTPTPTPNNQGAAPTPGRQPGSNSRTPANPPLAATSTPAPAGAILTAKGPVMTDPRVAEMNYLSLASLGEDDAKAAIAFLSANGVDAIGVPNRVESGSGRANNQGPTQVFRIYALPGITRDEYSQKLTARTNIEAAVAKIGATWQKEHRGASNFARTMWEKYRP